MLIPELRKRVVAANRQLKEKGLVIETWGNVSGYDANKRLVAIKPSGISYDKLAARDISVVTLDGRRIEGKKHSVDTEAHLEIYRAFANEGLAGVTHTHSFYGVVAAMLYPEFMGKGIPICNSTHADLFGGAIPVTEYVSNNPREIGAAIIKNRNKNVDAIIIGGHGPFTWGSSPEEAVKMAIGLEFVLATVFKAMELGKSFGIKIKPFTTKEATVWYSRHQPGGGYGQY